MKVIIASKNPVKINATKEAFCKVFSDITFEFEGVSVPSGVPDQPMSGKEALTGATNRALNAADTSPDGDFFVGLEGGVEDLDGKMHSFAWIAIRDKSGKIGIGKTGEFILPPKVRELILSGMELGKADDVVFERTNSKQENGAIGLLTKNIIDRSNLYTPAIVFALIPFINSSLYQFYE